MTKPTTQHERAKEGMKRPQTKQKYQGIFIAYVEGQSAQKVAKRFRVSVSTVYAALDAMKQDLPAQENPIYLNLLVEAARRRIALLHEEVQELRELKNRATDSKKLAFYPHLTKLLTELRKEEERLERLWGVTENSKLKVEIDQGYALSGERMAEMARLLEKYSTPKLDKPLPQHTMEAQLANIGRPGLAHNGN